MNHQNKYIDNFSESYFSGLDIKLCFLDVDGTIVSKFNEVSIETINTLKKVKKLGVHIALATGRPLFSVQSLIRELSITDPCVLFAGGMIYDPKTYSPLKCHCLPIDSLAEIVEFARQKDLYLELYTAQSHFVELKDHYLTHIHKLYQKITPELDNLLQIAANHEIIKAVIALDIERELDLTATLENTFSGVDFSTGFGGAHPNIKFVNIIPQGNLKELAFNDVLTLLDVTPEQTISFGDSYSDMTFSQLSKIGVAMENGVNELKEVATLVTKSAENDGIAYALKRIFRL